MATMPRELPEQDRALIVSWLEGEIDVASIGTLARWLKVSYAAVVYLEQREEHVIEVLREAQREGGGYGFVRGLLEYLGATEDTV